MRRHPRPCGSRALFPVALVALSATAPTQTFIVDANNGPGTSFTSLNTAAATVPSGSVLLVRPGTYIDLQIAGKGLAIVGEPGVQVGLTLALTISGTSASQRVLIRDLALSVPTFGIGLITCNGCQGPIVLERVAKSASSPPGPLRILSCAQVSLADCGQFTMYPSTAAVTIAASNVVLSRCNATTPVGTTIDVSGSALQLLDCQITAGAGAGLQLNGGDVRLLGNTAINAGSSVALAGTGNVVADPAVTISGGVGGGIALTTRPQAFVAATGGAVGTTATATLGGAPGNLGVLFVGELGPRLAIPGVQFDAWLQPATIVSAAAGVLGPPLTASFAVPPNPLLHGSAFCWQGATLSPAMGIELTNPGPLLP